MKKVLILIILIVILIALVVCFLAWKGYSIRKEEASVTTYKTEYIDGENPKIKIENSSKEKICFSSCYPYYLEKKNGTGFVAYKYGSCPENNLIETCINPGQVKAFELILNNMKIERGLFHRIAIPACVGCALNSEFREDRWLYSNEFIIK